MRTRKVQGPDVHLNLNVRGLPLSATLEINERSARLQEQGRQVFRLGLGQSPFPVPTSVVEELRNHAHEKDYLAVQGLPALREAVAEYHRRKQGADFSEADVLVGPGSKELMFLIQLVYYGDLVIPTPSWVSYAPQAHIIGRRIRWVSTRAENGWRMTPDELEALCGEDPDRPRILILNYPSNPTGGTYRADELRALARVARRFKVVLLSDEIYGDLHHDGRHVSIARYYPEGTIISTGLSKWCGAGGWRIGAFAFPRSLRWLLEAMAAVASETYTSTSSPIQFASVRAFEGGLDIERYLLHSRRILRALRRHLTQQLESVGIALPPAKGGFYLMADLSPLRTALAGRGVHTSQQLCARLLEDTGVAVLPGSVFGQAPAELTARLAYVDFDGAAALTGSAEVPLQRDLSTGFLEDHCGKVLAGVTRICEWIDDGGNGRAARHRSLPLPRRDVAPGALLWRPSRERARASRMARLAAAVGLEADQQALHAWSVAEPEAFWRRVWELGEVRGEPGERTLIPGEDMPAARWFPDARLSFAENLLRRRDAAPALVFRREDGMRRELSHAALYDEVTRLRGSLRRLGLVAGDRVAAYVPNVPEAVAFMLAATSLGAVWSSCSPDFGVAGAADRFGQIEPRVLLVTDGYLYKGERHDLLPKVAELAARIPSIEHVAVVPYLDDRPRLDDLPGGVDYRQLAWAPPCEEPFERFAFDHPLYVLFSSGTTGKPKCIVHGAGGTLLQHLKEHRLHVDLGPDDRLLYYTTTGWMMWNWLVSGLASGATLVLFDGAPFQPGPEALWDLAAQEAVTVFGTSAKYLDACKKAGLEPARTHQLDALHTILSTGSPLVAESFRWIYAAVKRDVLLAPISGGTDIVSCFALSSPLLPVHAGEMQALGLGMAVDVWDDRGVPVRGRPGELVCTAPFPSMPVGFWNDPDGARYRAAYFEHFPGVWRHGDWAELTGHGGLVIHGRSDATLNPGGVRIGTAEIYRQVEQIDEVQEALVVGQEWGGDQRIALFVVLRSGLRLDDALRARIRSRVRENASPRHVPAAIAQVGDLPRTRSGKISEIAVREVIHGRPIGNTEALANPGVLDEFRARRELSE